MNRSKPSKGSRAILILLFPILLLGCTESSLFVPDLSEEEEPTVSTVEAGSVVEPEGTIPITLPEGSDGEYSRLEITIRTPEGEVVHSALYDSVILSEPILPDLELPQLEPGSYIVELLLFDQQEEVAREESLFFVTDAELSVSGITLYPPTSETESQLIAEAHIRNSDPTLDPYLRWRFRDDLVSEGLISEEGATARLATGAESGVFAVTVELFPYAPPESLIYDLRSPTFHSTDVVVRSSGDRVSPQAEEDLYLAYHFDGHGRAEGGGAAEREADWDSVGEPVLTLRDDLFGFRIDESNGFARRGFLIPVEQGNIVPFRLEITLSLLSLGKGESFLLGTGDGGREFLFGLSSSGTPWVTVDNGTDEATVVSPAPIVTLEELATLGVEFYPGENQSHLLVYEGETLLHEAVVPFGFGDAGTAVPVSSEPAAPRELEAFSGAGVSRGSLLLAGEGASFVIDELTLRTVDSRSRERLAEVFATLDSGETTELETPSLRGEAVRYTVLPEEEEVVLYLEAEFQDSRRTLATLEEGATLVLQRRNGEIEYILDGSDRLPFTGEALFLRNGPMSPEVDISRQSVPR